jgi:hypothetical protein
MTLQLEKGGEDIVKSFLDCIDDKKFEVKFDQYRNGRMVVEVEQNPGSKGWKPSGLMTTEATWWVYVFSPQAFIAVEVERLKRYLKINNKIELKEFAKNSNNPTRGYLLYPEDVNKLLSSELYDMVHKK